MLESAARVYLQRLSVIWSSPLSDHHKVVATNHFALPVLVYFMKTQAWPITELQRLDRESRKVLVENSGKHPLATSDLLYLPRRVGGRELKSIEAEYKLTKVKAAVRLYNSSDPTMQLVRQFEKARRTGRHSLIGDAQRLAETRRRTWDEARTRVPGPVRYYGAGWGNRGPKDWSVGKESSTE